MILCFVYQLSGRRVERLRRFYRNNRYKHQYHKKKYQ